MGKHGRPRAAARVSAMSIVAVAVVIVIVVVGGFVVVHSLTTHHSTAAGAPPASSPQPASTLAPSVALASPASSPSSSPGDDTLGSPAVALPTPSDTGFLSMSGDSGAVMTPALATNVVVGLWDMREQALKASSESQLRRIEGGVALASDTSALQCRCFSYDLLAPSSVSAVVPRGSTYPYYFIGEVAASQDSSGIVELFVVSRASAAATWQITLVSGFSTDKSADGALDTTGWAGDAGEAIDADGHGLAQLVQLWQQAKDYGKKDAGAFYDQAWLTSDRLDELAQYPQDKPQANGLRGHFTFAVDTSVAPKSIEASTGDLVCGAIRETVVDTPAPGHVIEQDPDQPLFGASLAPGAYMSVTGTVDWQVCLEQYAGSPIVAFGWDPGPAGSFVGVPEPKGRHLPADPAEQQPADPDSSGSTGGSAGSGSST
ncbi:MAG: hypothetical protein ACRDV3_01070 [Acidothermaceae bacterium]